MQLTRGALGMLVQRYRAVLKKCRVLNVLGGMLLGVALLGGTALAADHDFTDEQIVNEDVTYDDVNVKEGGAVKIVSPGKLTGNNVAVKDKGKLAVESGGKLVGTTGVTVEAGGALKVESQGELTGATVTVSGEAKVGDQGKLVGTAVTVNGALESAKNVYLGETAEAEDGLVAKNSLTIGVGGTARASYLKFLEDAKVLTVNGRLELIDRASGQKDQNLLLGNGRVLVDASGGGEGKLWVDMLTIHKDNLVTGTPANGQLSLQNNGRLKVSRTLTITGGDYENTLGGNLEASVLALDEGKKYEHNTTGKLTLRGEEGKFFVGSAFFVKNGEVNFQSHDEDLDGNALPLANEKTSASVAVEGGKLYVRSGKWTVASLEQSGTGLVTVGEDLKNKGPAKLKVAGAVKNVEADGSKGITVANGGALRVNFANVIKNAAMDLQDNVNRILVKAGGTLELQGKEEALDFADVKKLSDNILTVDSKGIIIGIKITADSLKGKTLQQIAAASASVPDAVVASDGNDISKVAVVSGITGDATTVKSDAGLNLTGKASDFSTTDITLDAGTLILGTADSTGRALNGNITMQGAGTTNNVIVEGSNHTIKGDIKTTGTSTNVITVQGGSHTISGKVDASTATGTTINVNNGATLAVNGGVKGAGHTKINVGDANSKGTLVASGIQMNGGRIDFDPPFVKAGDISNASEGLLKFDSDKVDGLMNVGQNSMVSLGSTDAGWLKQEVERYQSLGHGLWGKDVTAALALRAPQTLAAAGGINVDGTWTNKSGAGGTANTATFADKSLLVVDAAGVGDKVALTGDGAASALKVDGGAKLHIVGGKGGSTVHITDKFNGGATTVPTSWTGKNLTTSTALLSATDGTFGAGGKYSVTLKANAASDMFPQMSGEMSGLVGDVVTQTGIDPASDNAGVRFVSRAVSDNYIGRQDRDKAAATIEGAAQIAPVGAVQASTMNVANVASGAALNRTSLALPRTDSHRTVALHQDADGVSLSGMSAGDGMKNGLGLWLMPLYQTSHVWGMESGDFEGGYHSSLGGIALGADYTVNDMFRFGAAFNIGAGYAQSSGDFNGTDNRFNFWGVSLYGGWVYNNFGLTADVGYTSNYNKLQQDLPASMLMNDLKSDVTSHAWNTGLKAEYKFNAGVLDIIPHVSVRYLGLVTDKHDVTSGGDTVFEVDRSVQSIWTFPLGLTFAANLESANGWTFKPQLDLGVIPATGDVKARSKVRIPGVDSSAEMKMQVVDYLTFDGGAGFELAKGDFSVGLNYNLQASEHRTGHGVFGTLRYEF